MKTTLTTTEACTILGIDTRSFTRWARKHGILPLRQQRIGRSTVTVWDITTLTNATRMIPT